MDLQDGLLVDKLKIISSKIDKYIYKTPVFNFKNNYQNTVFKFEFLQQSGCFKARGALNNILSLNKNQKERGITTVSAGNHGIATAYASKELGVNAKILLPKTVDDYRLKKIKEYEADVILVEDISKAFEEMRTISLKETRSIIHPYEGLKTMQGTGTLGLEIMDQVDNFENILVAVGGGGLISGVGAAIKQIKPNIKLIGVEPQGARGMTDSLNEGKPLENIKLNTIADSMAAPHHFQQNFEVCKQVIDKMVIVTDDEIRLAMAWAYDKLKLCLEPAGCSVIAALNGPLKKKLKGKKNLAILCGSNISEGKWIKLLKKN